MGRIGDFNWKCVKQAARNNTAFANDWQWLFGIPVFAGVVQFLKLQREGSKEVIATDWPILDSILIAFLAFIITWILGFLWRLARTPAAIYLDIKDQHEVLLEKQKPHLSLRFNPEGTECLHHPVAGTTYIRIVAHNDSDVRLMDSRAYLERVEFQRNSEFVPLLHFSPVNLAWSGIAPSEAQKYGAIALEPYSMRQPIDVIKAGYHTPGVPCLLIENPAWSPNWLSEIGIYRLRIVVTGKNAKPKELRLCVEWNGNPEELRAWEDKSVQAAA